MIIVDATVLADLLIGEGAVQAAAETLVREDPDWISTSLWSYEFGNAMLMAHRHGKAAIEDPERRLLNAGDLILESAEVDRAGVWNVAGESGLTYYDSSYVWLARERGLKLRTRDTQILKQCGDVAVPMPVVEY